MITFLKRIQHIMKWLPILWKDQDWDYAYLVELVIFKLQCMEREFRCSGIHVSSPHKALKIRIVIEHFKRFLNPPGDDILDFQATRRTNDGLLTKPYQWKTGILFPWQQYKHSDDLAQWHWQQAWKLIMQYGRCWWD